MPRRNFSEGDWFSIQVPNNYLPSGEQRFGAGLVARGKKGRCVFSYIFGPWSSQASPEDLASLQPKSALLNLVMPDDGLRSGRFPIIWKDPSFSRELWPMPELGMYMGGENEAWAVRTEPDEPFDASEKRRVTPAVALSLPQYSVSGYAVFFRRLADPSIATHRIAHVYREVDNQSSERSQKLVSVSFVTARESSPRLDQVSAELKKAGWQVIEPGRRTTTESECVWLVAVAEVDVGASPLASLDLQMEHLAETHDVEYDGHGVDVVS